MIDYKIHNTTIISIMLHPGINPGQVILKKHIIITKIYITFYVLFRIHKYIRLK